MPLIEEEPISAAHSIFTPGACTSSTRMTRPKAINISVDTHRWKYIPKKIHEFLYACIWLMQSQTFLCPHVKSLFLKSTWFPWKWLTVAYFLLLAYTSQLVLNVSIQTKNTRDMSECFTKIYLYTRSLKLHGHKLQHCWCEAEVFRSFSTLDYWRPVSDSDRNHSISAHTTPTYK